MAEKIEQELGKITVKYICDKCGEGEMKYIGFRPPLIEGGRYFSVCVKKSCKFEHKMLRKYPYTLEIMK